MCIKWWNETTSFKLTVGLFIPQWSVGSNNRAELWIYTHTHKHKTFCNSPWIISTDWYNRDIWISFFPSVSLVFLARFLFRFTSSPAQRAWVLSLVSVWRERGPSWRSEVWCGQLLIIIPAFQCRSALTEIFSLLSRCHPSNSRLKFSRSQRRNEQPQELSFTK